MMDKRGAVHPAFGQRWWQGQYLRWLNGVVKIHRLPTSNTAPAPEDVTGDVPVGYLLALGTSLGASKTGWRLDCRRIALAILSLL